MSALQHQLLQHPAQVLSPRLQQAVRLLQLSTLEFTQELRALMGSNPFIEMLDADGTEGEPADPAEHAPDADRDGDPWIADVRDAGSTRVPCAGGEDDAAQRMAGRTSLAESLHAQLSLQPLAGRDLALARALIDSLEDDGYLRMPLNDVAPCAALVPPACPAEMRIAMRRVQSLEPVGVGARSLGECLTLQTRDMADPASRALARTIIADHLPSLAASGDPSGLARKLNRTCSDVLAACEAIRRMDPQPGSGLSAPPTPYIVPDVVVRKVRGTWSASLNPAALPRVQLNQGYADLFEGHRAQGDHRLADHLREARWAVRSVQQRFATILDVTQAIVRRQSGFLELGEMALKPMRLKEVADEVGIHESTVSRVTNNKFMATRLGVFELKHFFSRAMTSRAGAAFSGKAVRELVAEMIRGEPAAAPLTDAVITTQLERQGLALCRRTVTKYRLELRIPSAEQRRTPAGTFVAA